MKHKHLTFLLAVLMSMAASVVSAHDFEVDGIYYKITSSSSPYTVAVTYRGTYGSEYEEYTGGVTIPESVTYNSTFYSVTSIGERAFQGCSGLTSVTIPNSVTYIGVSAFSGCTGLTSVSIGNSVTTIGGSAFSDCSGLTSVSIGNSVTTIGGSAFSDCSGLTSITIPNSVTLIGKSAFIGCRFRNLMIKSPTPPTLWEAFSPQTYYHTTLYVPMDAWDAYAYNSNWYQFINIRETAMSEEEVNTDRAYTLMNAKTFTYAVYDPVNDCIGSIKSIGALDENNPNHSWQTLDVKGQKYLYNIGARRFAVPTNDGTGLRLLDNADSITMTDNEDGIVLNGHAETPWALVSNERMSIDRNAEENVTGLKAIDNEQLTIDNVYDLSGRQQGKMQRGVNLLRMSDGTTKKVLVK